MGIMTIPVAKSPEQDAVYNSDGKLLARLIFTDFERLAVERGVTPLSHYVIDGGSFEEPRPSIPTEGKYFDACEGLETVRALKATIAGVGSLSGHDRASAGEAVEELERLESWLVALGEGNEFYLLLA